MLYEVITLINKDKIDDVKDYINNLTNLQKSSLPRFNTGNYIADGILDDKCSICTMKNINFQHQGVIPLNKIEPIDVCVIFSNTLDNAIEACEIV